MNIEERLSKLETSVALLQSQIVNLANQLSSVDIRTRGQIVLGPSQVPLELPNAQQIPLDIPEAMEKEIQQKFELLAKELLNVEGKE